MSKREVFAIIALLIAGFVGWEVMRGYDAEGPDEVAPGETPEVAGRSPSVAAAAVFVDEGACPGEGCSYGAWTAERETSLYDSPDDRAAATATIAGGETVTAVSGQVHTVPGRFVVSRAHKGPVTGHAYLPGDVVTVYTYRGEGVFLVTVDGERYEEELGFSPWGGSGGSRCEASERCWGTLQEDLRFTWWVLIERADGSRGWSKTPEHFVRRGDDASM